MKRNKPHVCGEAKFQVGIAWYEIDYSGTHRQMLPRSMVMDKVIAAVLIDDQKHPVERMPVATSKLEAYFCRFDNFQGQVMTEMLQIVTVDSSHESINYFRKTILLINARNVII